MRYKNMFTAYSIEIAAGVIIILLIYFIDPNLIFLLSLFALRPLLLEKIEISLEDKFWCVSYEIGKYSLIATSFVIIILFLINEFLIDTSSINSESLIILSSIVPLYLLIHGITGLIFYKSGKLNNSSV
ncbi:MAG: hypothetical protein IPM56_15525 [Ignavibacteriales bacterium]|nr:MAG: hypothetical protein IPM56_15525 [Ignavibacteriales bacterium]